jgi:hypothetical protein
MFNEDLASPSACLVAVFAVTALSGCGTSSSVAPAPKQTIELAWHEAPGLPGNRLVVDVRRLVIRRDSWTVAASIENETRGMLGGHIRAGTACGWELSPHRTRILGTSKPERPIPREFRYITNHALLLRRA